MARRILSIQELYEIYKDTVTASAGNLTDFSEGSIHEIIGSSFAVLLNEASELFLNEFKKTYFATAAGSDLDNLATDRFGNRFIRPVGNHSAVTVTFSRPSSASGVQQLIPSGTIVSTEEDSSGNVVTFHTSKDAWIFPGSLSTRVTCVSGDVGADQNVGANTITVIVSTLENDNGTTVTNLEAATGGTAQQTDAQYRETIKNLIESLAGATRAAVRGSLLSVSGVEKVVISDSLIPVILYDIGRQAIDYNNWGYFRYTNTTAYISGLLGVLPPNTIANAKAAIENIKAAGVNINIASATVLRMAWHITVTLNSSGPNYSVLSTDTEQIRESMREYINDKLDIGQDFIRADAEKFIIKTWGAEGTNDIQSIVTTLPITDVGVSNITKLIADQVVAS